MSESIRNLLQGVPDKRTAQVLERALDAARADSVALRASLVTVKADLTALRTAITGLTAKLDLDAGVTDENYASALDPAALTTTDPAATTLLR